MTHIIFSFWKFKLFCSILIGAKWLIQVKRKFYHSVVNIIWQRPYVLPGTISAQDKKWTLKECISEALDKNIALNQNEINNEINKINYTQSKANLYPNLNASDAHDLYYGRAVNPLTGQYIRENASDNSPALTSAVTLFNGSRNFNLVKENKLTCQAGTLDIEKMKNDLALKCYSRLSAGSLRIRGSGHCTIPGKHNNGTGFLYTKICYSWQQASKHPLPGGSAARFKQIRKNKCRQSATTCKSSTDANYANADYK